MIRPKRFLLSAIVTVGLVALAWPANLQATKGGHGPKRQPGGGKVQPKPPVKQPGPPGGGGRAGQNQGGNRGTPGTPPGRKPPPSGGGNTPPGGTADPNPGNGGSPSWPVSGGDVGDWWEKVKEKVGDEIGKVGDTIKDIEDGLRGKDVIEATVRGAIAREERGRRSKEIQKKSLQDKLQRLENEKNSIAFDKIPNTLSPTKRAKLNAEWNKLHKEWLAVLGRIQSLDRAIEQHNSNIARQQAILNALKKAAGF